MNTFLPQAVFLYDLCNKVSQTNIGSLKHYIGLNILRLIIIAVLNGGGGEGETVGRNIRELIWGKGEIK